MRLSLSPYVRRAAFIFPERLHERSSETSRTDVGVRSGGYVIAMGIGRPFRIVRDQTDLAGPE